jgi:nicotinamidase-related amidase
MDHYTRPEWDRSALITIDTQEDFTRADGAACIAGTVEVLPTIQCLLSAYREKRLPIIHVVRLYKNDGSNADICRRSLVEGGRSIVSPGSTGSELAAELRPLEYSQLDATVLLQGHLQEIGAKEWAIYKPRWGAFYATKLAEHLRLIRVTTIVVVGCNFPNCPRMTIYEASERDLRVVVVSDAISGIYDRGINELRAIDVQVLPAAEVVRAVKV